MPPYDVPAELNLQLVANLDFLITDLPISIPLDRFAIWAPVEGIDVMFGADLDRAISVAPEQTR